MSLKHFVFLVDVFIVAVRKVSLSPSTITYRVTLTQLIVLTKANLPILAYKSLSSFIECRDTIFTGLIPDRTRGASEQVYYVRKPIYMWHKNKSLILYILYYK